MKIIPKGYVREKNNNPVSFDELGNLTDQITGEKGTMMLPGLTVRGISPETRAKKNDKYDSLNKSESIESKVSTAIMNLIHRGKLKPSNHPVPDLVRDGGVPQRTYLLGRKELRKEFLNAGYIEGKEGDYGLVRKAVGDRNIPIYQREPDAAKREDLVPIGNIDSMYYPEKGKLIHAGHYPTALYYNYQDNKLYLKAWDLNDYGGNTGYAKKYNFLQKLGANILDKIGSPTVVTSGFLEIPEDIFHSNYNELFPYLKNFYKSKGLEYDFLVDPYKDTPTPHLPEIVVTNKSKKYAGGGYIKENNNSILNTILKHQQGGIIDRSPLNFVKNDNTRVAKPIIYERIPYKLKPNEFYFVDKKTGKKTLIKLKLETVNADKRSTYLKKLDKTRTELILKKYEADKNYNEGLKTIGALTTLAMPSTYIGPVFNNNGKSYLDNVISGEGTGDAAGNLTIDLLTPLATGSTIKGGSYVYNTGNRLYNNWLDLKDLRNFMSRYQYNLINPKNSIIFNDSKLDRLFNHIVESHNTFTRGVDPYEAVKFGRFPEGSDVEEVARYSLTHIPVPTATNDAGLLPGEAALYTSNSIGLSLRYTNGNGYIGILRRPINYNFKTRRDFLHGNDFRFNPIPHNLFSITTDFPKDFKPWTIKLNRLDSRNPRKYLGRVPRYTLTPLNSFQVRANAGAFPIKNTNVTDAHFRHYLFIGSPNEQPLELIRMYPYKGPKGISDYDYTSVGLSHKK